MVESMRLAILVLSTIVSCASWAGKKYSWEDLKALEKNDSWQEIVRHLNDVAPTARDEKWKTLAERAVVEQMKSESDDNANWYAENALKEYPFLKKSAKFVSIRNEVGIKSFEKCFSQSYDGGDCYDRLMTFLKSDADNRELAMKAAKLVIRNQNAYGAVPFFKRAVAGNPGAKECTDEDLQRATIAGMGLPPDNKLFPESREIAGTLCWESLKSKLLEQLKTESKGSYFTGNACPMLKAKRAMEGLSADDKEKCEKSS